MTTTKISSPSPSYSLAVPINAIEQYEDGVTSYCIDESDIALQVSSYLRTEGEQITADERLRDAIARTRAKHVVLEHVEIDDCPDTATATLIDAEGVSWTYCYAVWPDLAVFALISGASKEFVSRRGWALSAVQSIARGSGDPTPELVKKPRVDLN